MTVSLCLLFIGLAAVSLGLWVQWAVPCSKLFRRLTLLDRKRPFAVKCCAVNFHWGVGLMHRYYKATIVYMWEILEIWSLKLCIPHVERLYLLTVLRYLRVTCCQGDHRMMQTSTTIWGVEGRWLKYKVSSFKQMSITCVYTWTWSRGVITMQDWYSAIQIYAIWYYLT